MTVLETPATPCDAPPQTPPIPDDLTVLSADELLELAAASEAAFNWWREEMDFRWGRGDHHDAWQARHTAVACRDRAGDLLDQAIATEQR